jgi:choline dehydrogenase
MKYQLLLGIIASSIGGASAQWGQIGGSLFGSYFGVPLTNATFDYVIVGGGLAGLTVASRLAENKSLSIAVVEPGSFYEISNGNLSQIPLYSEQYVSKDPSDVQPLIDWGLLTTLQPVSPSTYTE